MRKLPLTAVLLAACAVCLVAQEEAALLDVGNYSKLFLNKFGELDDKYIMASSDEDYEKIAVLSGNPDYINTPLEISLLSYAAGVVNIRPPEADKILPENNPRAAGLKLGSAVLKELAELKFLDPSNTAAIGRYEGMIKYISDKNGVSRADIEDYLKQGIAAVVDEEFNKISFMLDTDTDGANAKLIRQPNGYVLICDGYWGNPKKEEVRQFSASSINALLTVMNNSGNFKSSATETVQNNAALIPATKLSSQALNDIKEILTNFYTHPNDPIAYDMVKAVYSLYQNLASRRGNDIFEKITTAYSLTLYTFSTELEKKVVQDWLQQRQAYTTLTSEQQKILASLQN
jgi:hypothetical protein